MVSMTGGKADCVICEDRLREMGEIAWWERSFMVCGECGNKRCPKATWHDNPCSGSNEPGQPGSVYGSTPLVTADPFSAVLGYDPTKGQNDE